MDILSHLRDGSFIGVLLTEKPFRVSSKKKGKKNAIVAKLVEHWLNDPKNKLIILNQLCELARNGTAIGMTTGIGSLLTVPNSKFYAKTVIKLRRIKKTK